MNRLSLTFVITSLACLFVLALAPLKDHWREWRQIQRDYHGLLEEVAPEQLELSNEIQIQQIWIPELGDQVDRCPTCHAAMFAPADVQAKLANAPQPYRPHPEDAHHPFEWFGCVPCHSGQGRATSTDPAHGHEANWDRPMFPQAYIEAGCGRCHLGESVPEALVLSAGRQLMTESKCLDCHRVAGQEPPEHPSPDLDGLGSKLDPDWLVRWLQKPKETLPNAAMPDFQLTEEETQALSGFLLSSRVSLSPLPEAMGDYDVGGTRFREVRCISCHPVNGRGGPCGPDLGNVAAKVNRRWLLDYLRDPHRFFPDTLMPQYGFTEQDALDIAEYMMFELVSDATFDTNPDWEPLEEPKPFAAEDALVTRGGQLYRHYGCYACHQIKGSEPPKGYVGPELTGIADKAAEELDFGDVDIPYTSCDWLFTKLKTPRVFSDRLQMPDFAFNDEQIIGVVTALLSLTEDQVPAKYRVADPPESDYHPVGEVGQVFARYRCLSCHELNGNGETLADADLTWEGSKVTRDWLVGYMRLPFAIKPILEERMPRLLMSEQEANLIADYIEMVCRNDAIPTEVFSDEAPSPELIREGRGLYFDRYGCQACHMIEGSGGFVGPSLDNAPPRLTEGWVFRWLLDPHALKPGAREPNFGMSRSEAKALTAYILYRTGMESQHEL